MLKNRKVYNVQECKIYILCFDTLQSLFQYLIENKSELYFGNH